LGAIVVFVTALGRHIYKITKSKIALFFTNLVSWTTTMVFGKFIAGEELNAAFIGVTASVGVIFALFTVVVYRISEKSKR
jgi:hypothetical protein